MARSVADAAAILSVIAGKDPLDNATLVQPEPVPDFSLALNLKALRGVRLGVPRALQGSDPNVLAAFNASLDILRGLGATIGEYMLSMVFGARLNRDFYIVKSNGSS